MSLRYFDKNNSGWRLSLDFLAFISEFLHGSTPLALHQRYIQTCFAELYDV